MYMYIYVSQQQKIKRNFHFLLTFDAIVIIVRYDGIRGIIAVKASRTVLASCLSGRVLIVARCTAQRLVSARWTHVANRTLERAGSRFVLTTRAVVTVIAVAVRRAVAGSIAVHARQTTEAVGLAFTRNNV